MQPAEDPRAARPRGTGDVVRADAVGHRTVRLLAWGLWGFWAALTVALVLLIRGGTAGEWSYGVLTVGYATVGALVASRHGRNAVGWLMLAFALLATLFMTGRAYAWTDDYPAYLYVGWVMQWVMYPAAAILLVFVPLVYPEGGIRTRGQLSVLRLGIVAVLAGVVGAAFKPDELDVSAPGANPLGVQGAGAVFGTLEGVGQLMLGMAAVLAAVSLIGRFRRSRGVERQQLKWFTFAGVLLVVGLAVFFLAGGLVVWSLLRDGDPGRWAPSVSRFALGISLMVAVLGLPLAIAVAIFRYRLYDIDVVINKTVVYGTLTATLLSTYLLSVFVLTHLLAPMMSGSDFAVAASTLAVAAAFKPARRRIQNAVDRRFYRSKYDAAQTLDEFAVRLRHELDLDAVGADLCAAAGAAVQPTHVSLWMRP